MTYGTGYDRLPQIVTSMQGENWFWHNDSPRRIDLRTPETLPTHIWFFCVLTRCLFPACSLNFLEYSR